MGCVGLAFLGRQELFIRADEELHAAGDLPDHLGLVALDRRDELEVGDEVLETIRGGFGHGVSDITEAESRVNRARDFIFDLLFQPEPWKMYNVTDVGEYLRW